MNKKQKEELQEILNIILNLSGSAMIDDNVEDALTVLKNIETTEEPLELKEGQIVKLRNGTIIGPLTHDDEEGIRFPFYVRNYGSWTSSGMMLVDKECNKDIVEIIAQSEEELTK